MWSVDVKLGSKKVRIKIDYYRNLYAYGITKHDSSFLVARVKVTSTTNEIPHNATVDNILTLVHVQSDIFAHEGFRDSDKDDLVKLVVTLLQLSIFYSVFSSGFFCSLCIFLVFNTFITASF